MDSSVRHLFFFFNCKAWDLPPPGLNLGRLGAGVHRLLSRPIKEENSLTAQWVSCRRELISPAWKEDCVAASVTQVETQPTAGFFFILFHVYPRQGPVRRLPEQPGQSAELRGTAVATEVISRAVLSVSLPSSTNFSITYGREAAP